MDLKRSLIGNIPKNDKERIGSLQETINAKEHYVKKLEKELAELKENAIVPKFKEKQKVYYLMDCDIGYGQIDLFNFYTKQYLVFITNWNGFELGDTLFLEKELFATKAEAEEALKNSEG